MRKWIAKMERYPDFWVEDDAHGPNAREVDIPDDLIAEAKCAGDAYEAVQEKLRALYKAASI